MSRETRIRQLIFAVLLSLNGSIYAQHDSLWVTENVQGISWLRTNQSLIDSMLYVKPNSYDPPHEGATELTFNLDGNHFSLVVSGSTFDMHICDYSLEKNKNYFKLKVGKCDGLSGFTTQFIYGYIEGNNLFASFCNIDIDINTNLIEVIESDERSNWLKFEAK